MRDFLDRVEERLSGYVPSGAEGLDGTPAAVIVPFFEKQGAPHLLFTKRSGLVHHHPNEISFPGGKQAPEDEDLRQTALRELQEEVSVPPHHVRLLGRLDSVRTLTSHFLVVPYVGFIEAGTTFAPNRNEVDELLEIPFDHFNRPEIFEQQDLVFERSRFIVYYYRWNEYTIWGLTGRILKMLLDILNRPRDSRR